VFSLIDLDIPVLGYKRFISAWLYSGPEMAFVVDPGPACTNDILVEALRKKGVQRLDRIFLTHIHMDHAGGAGHLVRQFPEATIVCHPKAVDHLVDPSRLWEGTRKVLGKIADIYGPMVPVSREKITTPDRISDFAGIKIIDTPGHAAHHQSYVFLDRLFVGELFGVFHDVEGQIYLRPATPPRFIYEQFEASMDRVATEADRKVCFGHYGMHQDGAKILEIARNQLGLWVDVVRKHSDNPDNKSIIADLKKNDPVFALIDKLPEVDKKREAYFIGNTIAGILDYIRQTGSD
jgi:glyoxylase-like metal-dependent hydrolase (beta-lactamase superfamily II)